MTTATARTKKPETSVNYIFEYYQKLKNGTASAGRWVIAAYEMLVRGLESKEFFFDAKKAKRAIKFIENFCSRVIIVCQPHDHFLICWSFSAWSTTSSVPVSLLTSAPSAY